MVATDESPITDSTPPDGRGEKAENRPPSPAGGLVIQTAGRDGGNHPYHRDICKVNIDTGELIPLTSGDFDYRVMFSYDYFSFRSYYWGNSRLLSEGVSSNGDYIVATRSRIDTVPETILIDRHGKERLCIEKADMSAFPVDWKWPEHVKLKAADGKTDTYGTVFFPTDYSPDTPYPVLDMSVSSRMFTLSPTGSFHNASIFVGQSYFWGAAYAALGFIVVMIDGRGTTGREKAFLTHRFGDQAFTNDIDDRIAGIQQLAKRYPMDLDRVGISADENGTHNSIYGLLQHSDFYKVGVVHCLPDVRCQPESFVSVGDGFSHATAEPKTPWPEECVESFDGKLLLIQGMSPWGIAVPTFRLVDALNKANKDFDMLCLPSVNQQITGYTVRRDWDYLVRHLMGEKPPKQFKLKVTPKELSDDKSPAAFSKMVEDMTQKAKDLAEKED